jgi:hypothetical protein
MTIQILLIDLDLVDNTIRILLTHIQFWSILLVKIQFRLNIVVSQVGPGFAKPQSGIAAAHGALDQPAGNGDVARRHGF